MSKDPVANVRMNVSRALKIVIPRLKDKSGEVINFDYEMGLILTKFRFARRL